MSSLRTSGFGWLVSAASLCVALAGSSDAHAQPTLRVSVDQPGDFAMIGNTLAYDCGSAGPAPVIGTVGACGLNTVDTAPDVYWRSDDQNGTAAANTGITTNIARSTAVLNLPNGATVSHAYLFWAGESTGQANTADPTVTFERPDGMGGTVFSQQVTAAVADRSVLLINTESYFQSVADVTALVAANGSGPYRVGGVNLVNMTDYMQEISYASWTLVVFYQDTTEPPRNLTLFDGLDVVGNMSATATLSGFLVPNAGYDAKLGVIAYEGDEFFVGDELRFGVGVLTAADALSNGPNPANNFFNSSRTNLGVLDSDPGDLPRLTGAADTMASVDFDIIDITNRVSGGQTSADIEATTVGDVYFLGAFITSISTFEPNLSTSNKTWVDVNGGAVLIGDEIEYTINAINSGNDNAINVVLTDPLPMGVTYKPGSIQITAGPNAGPKTDVASDDQGEYDSNTNTVIVRLGTGANATTGGQLNIGQSTTVTFVVTIDSGQMGNTIANQADITFEGQQGAPQQTEPTDGGQSPGFTVDDCMTDTDCGGANNGMVCDAMSDCVPGCRGIGADSGCPPGQTCTSMDTSIGQCIPDGSGGAGGMASAAGGSSAGGNGNVGGAGVTAGAGGGGANSGSGTSSGTFAGNDSGQTGACGCRLPGAPSDDRRGLALLALLGLFVGLARRRR